MHDAQADGIVTLVTTRVAIEADGVPITWVVDRIEPVAGQDAVGIAWHAALSKPPGHLAIGARLFPEDATHQTFVTVYEGGGVTWQEVLNRDRVRADHYTGTTQGRLAVFRRFVASGIHREETMGSGSLCPEQIERLFAPPAPRPIAVMERLAW